MFGSYIDPKKIKIGPAGMSMDLNPTVLVDDPDINIATVSNPHSVIYSYTGSGKIYGFSFEYSNRNCMARLVIDGTEIFDIDCGILGNMLTSSTASEIVAGWTTFDRNNDLFHFCTTNPFIFNTSFSIEARANNNNTGRYVGRYKVEYTQES